VTGRKTSGGNKSGYTAIVICVTFAAFMSKLDSYIVNISLPTISNYFHVSASEVSRTVMIYLLVGTSTLLFFGKLGDRIGLKKVFVLGYIFFTLGSFFCGISWNINILVLSRFLQGIGGAMLISTAYAIIPKFLPQEISGWAFGIVATGTGFGIAAGAPLGGLINGYLSWQWIFFINVPVGIAAIVAAVKAIPADRGDAAAGAGKTLAAFDIPGTALSFLGLSFLLYALNMGDELGWTSRTIILVFSSSFVLLAAFLFWEKICSNPLFDFDLFRNRKFVYANLGAFFAYMLLAGNAFLMPFYLEIGKGLSTVQAGFVIMINSVVVLIGGPVAGRMSDRIAPSILCSIAMMSAALSAFAFSYFLAAPGLWWAILFLLWAALSFAMFIPPNNNQIMKQAPSEKKGIASGVFNTVNTLGMVLGVCLLETIFSSRAAFHGNPSSGSDILREAGQGAMLFTGFRDAYAFGGLLCIAALFFSWLVKHGRAASSARVVSASRSGAKA